MEVLSPEYVAGFIDGEGSFGIYRDKGNKGFRHRISISNTHRPCLELIQKKYGGSLNTKKKMISGIPHYCHELHVRAEKQMKALLQDIAPFLVVRKEQAHVFEQSLNGQVPVAHAALRLKAMKRAVNVKNLEEAGLKFIEVVCKARCSKAFQA